MDAKISPFEAYNNTEYNKLFKMDNSNIESVKNNAGNNTGKPITYATDEDMNTAWESNTVNNDKFKNEVEIVFKEKVLLDRVVYGARQNDSKGFAEEFEIYGSKTTNGDTYELISTGKYNPVKGLIEAQFNPTEFKRMKFKFKKSKDNWATISEIAFYKQDVVSDKMDRLFTDNTLSVVSEEFNTIEKIEALENEVISHPLYSSYRVKIEDAKSILKTSQTEATSAKITQFNLYDNKKYSEVFKMNNSNIESIKNNAGNNMGKPITYATDEDINTAWESNTVNNDTFKNEIEIIFKDKIVLDRVVYGARQSDSKGFAQEFEIYGSNTTNGDTYKLITTGKSDATKGLIEAQFNPTEFKRMKFKFKKSKDNWATISEIAFYKQDLVSNKVNDLFKDGTMSELKDEFNSKDAIDSLANEIVNHPDKENLQKFIDRAYSILNNDFSKEQVKITLPQMGNVHKNATTNLAFSSFGTNYLTTGIVATPGEVIEVYVDADKNDPLPQIIFSQAIGAWSGWKNTYSLKPGYNKFTVPNIHNEAWAQKTNPGGALYLVNPYTSNEQSKAPVVIIEGGRKFPVYNEGDDAATFIEELKEYKKYMDVNPDTAVDVFEYNSKRIMFTGTTSDAYKVYVDEGLDVATSAKVWSSFTDEALKFAGLSDTDENVVHNSTNVRTAVRVMQPFGAAYAAGDHVGIQKHVADDFLRYDNKNINGILWGTMHEIGHQMDIPARTWGEVTNNMWANEMYIRNGIGCKINYNQLDKTVALNHNYDMEFEAVELGMFWQLEAFQKGYWGQLERLYRERKPRPKDYQEKKDILAKYSSEIIGMNLTEYYERYGFSLSEDAKKELSKLPALDKKVWYAHSNGREYTGSGFNENLDVKINSKMNEQNKTNTLTFEIDNENKDALLGYEILKDGVVIGFSRTNTFVVENINSSENTKYEVIPYDLKLNQGSKIVVDTFKPTIKSEEKITLEINEKFDLKEYVVANNYKGNVIDNIDIKHDIDISKSGIYNVEYKVVDNELEATTTTKVEVVSEYDYLSDFEWKSVKTQYGTPRKNTNIKARVNGEVKEYKKGFGIHANGEIVYDLSDKDYDTFETLLGVDMSIPSQNRSSVTFKIVVDGKTVQTTKVLKYDDDAIYVSVPVKGAKELKIEIHDGGNGNSSDHSIIANPKLTTNNSKPSLEIGADDIIKIGTEYDILKDVVATDAEDGNLITKVDVNDGGFNSSKSGEYKITYTVTDSNNNTVTKTKMILVYSDINYASDVKWESATTGWKTVNKDKAVGSENKIKLKVDKDIKEFDKGIGVSTDSEIVYDLEGKNYDYFSTYLGTDKNYNDNRTSIQFKILADGKEVYTSDVIRKDSQAEFVKIPLDGVKELKLVADNYDGNLIGDFSSWGDAKFYTTNSKPSLEIEDSVIINVGDGIDILGNYNATDIEDGDITSKVVVTGHENVNINKPGRYNLTYTITDNDNNTVTKERTISIIDERDYKYLTDYDWTSATQSYGTTQKDKNINGKELSLTSENDEAVVYERGIGSHANATIIYDLSDKNYDYFTSYIGVDRDLYNRPSSVVFEVYVDNEKKYDSKIMRSTDAQKFVHVDVTNAKELKLVVKDAGDGIGADHGTWGDAKLSFINEDRADLTNLNETLKKALDMNLDNYSKESVDNLNLVIKEANELIKLDLVTQVQADEMVNKLNEAIDNLQDLNQVITIEDKFLRESIIETLNLKSDNITLGDMHNLKTLICEVGYVRSLKGLEYAINLETLNIDFNEVSNISPIKELKKLNNFSGKENFIMNTTENVVFENGKFIIEDVAIDVDGQKLIPKEVVLSPRMNPIKLDLNEVLVGNKVVIDSSLIEKNESIEILYESKYNNYQLYTFYILNN